MIPSNDDLNRQRLITWINSHTPRPEPTVDNLDGTLTVSTECVAKDGSIKVEHDIIPATMRAARELLGY
jgi:hypothetical protein